MPDIKEEIEKVLDLMITPSGKTVREAKDYNDTLSDDDKKAKRISTKPRVCLENDKIALENDPRFKDRLYLNEIDLRIYKMKPFPWDDKNSMKKIPGIYGGLGMYLYNDNRDTSEIKRLIQRDYGQNLSEIQQEIYAEASRHTIHPVKIILENLDWDGKEHIKNLLPKYLGVKNDDYQAKALKLIMLTLITRIYQPGAKMDCVLSLGGKQGLGKSTFCRMLAFNDLNLFTDRLGDLSNKDTLQLVAGKLVIELAEMLALKKTKEIEAVKSFISAQQDTYRAPYAKTWEDHLRQCILLATTNENEYLSDLTGDRRWITVECDPGRREIDISEDPEAEGEFFQAWAEAYHIYKTEKPSIMALALELAPEAKKHAELHKEQDPKIGMIEDYLDRLRHESEKPRVCAVMIQQEVFHEYSTDRWKNKDISKIMDNCFPDWKRSEKRQRCGEYGIQVTWEAEPIEGIKASQVVTSDMRSEAERSRSEKEQLDAYADFVA